MRQTTGSGLDVDAFNQLQERGVWIFAMILECSHAILHCRYLCNRRINKQLYNSIRLVEPVANRITKQTFQLLRRQSPGIRVLLDAIHQALSEENS